MRYSTRPFLCGLGALLVIACRAASIEDVVRSEASEAIRWQAFWDGAESLGADYTPGNNIDIRVMRTPNGVYIVMGPVHMLLDVSDADATGAQNVRRGSGRSRSSGLTRRQKL